MASRYHWLAGGKSGTGSIDAVITTTALTIPAGGRLVRYLVDPYAHNQTGPIIDPTKVGARYWYQEVKINSTQYPNRIIHSGHWACEHVFFGGVTALPYSANNFIGYQQAGINAECSYGGPGKAAITFVVSALMGKMNGLHAGGTVDYGISLGVLYYL